jgi:UDP-glucose 4-epimerase
MKCLVTGSSGLIGSWTVEMLLAQGHEVHCLDRNPNIYNHGAISCYEVDLTDKEYTTKIIESIKPEVVFHFAANAAEGKSQFSPIDITQQNIGIFMNVIVPCINAGMKRFVYTSSVAVYGAIQLPFRESDSPMPQDIYGINKLACENALRVLGKVHDFEFVVVRPHNVYGERQNMTDPYRNVITIFMNSLLKGQPYSIYGDGSMKRCFSYVEDVVDVIVKCGFWDVAGMTVNIGSSKAYTINELSDMIREVSGIDIAPKYIPDRPQEVHIAESDHVLCHKVFGYHDTPLKEGLAKVWKWAKKLGSQELIYTGFEIESKKIPQNWK